MATRRFPVGTAVLVHPTERDTWTDDLSQWDRATVEYHGRDVAGVYTTVRYANGRSEKVHRSWIRKED